MANTTFTGPVRSQNGFQSISVNSTTGAVTTNATFDAATTVSTLTATTGITGNVTGNVVGSITLPTYTVTTANALSPKTAGKLIYVSNGLAGAPCVAVGDGTNWISPAGTAISAT